MMVQAFDVSTRDTEAQVLHGQADSKHKRAYGQRIAYSVEMTQERLKPVESLLTSF